MTDIQPSADSIARKLDRLAEYRAQRDLLDVQKNAAIDSVLTPEIRAKLAEINAEFEPDERAADESIAALELEVKADALAYGETVRGERVMAVWNRGRVSWDNAGLERYMEAHPEIKRFRRQGEPSISIKLRSGG